MAYTFTCPLDGCDHVVMNSKQQDPEEAAEELVAAAKQHLATSHPDIHKTDEEVEKDIRDHMIPAAA